MINLLPLFGPLHDEKQTETIEFSTADAALNRQDYGTVLGNRDLFWGIFCKAVAEKEHPKSSCTFNRNEKSIAVTAAPGVIKEIKNAAESLRELFENGYNNKKNLEIVPLKRGQMYYLKNSSPLPIPLSTLGTLKGIYEGRYLELIKPAMATLSKAFNASCEPVKIVQQTIKQSSMQVKLKEIDGFLIRWNPDVHIVYPLAPCKTYQGPDMRKELYSMYKDTDQPLCDYCLVANDGTAIKMHELVLRIYGGDVFKAAMSNNMVEASMRSITIPDASSQTVLHLVEYLYRGSESLEPPQLRGQEIDIASLFAIGHRYQIPGLVESCTNLLLARSTVNDIDFVMSFAATYSNEKLAELGLHLIKLANTHSRPTKEPAVQFESANGVLDNLYD